MPDERCCNLTLKSSPCLSVYLVYRIVSYRDLGIAIRIVLWPSVFVAALVRVYMHTCEYVYVCVCVFVCVYLYVCVCARLSYYLFMLQYRLSECTYRDTGMLI
jgi:hypothetical protein